jgi:hypothetical protein
MFIKTFFAVLSWFFVFAKVPRASPTEKGFRAGLEFIDCEELCNVGEGAGKTFLSPEKAQVSSGLFLK